MGVLGELFAQGESGTGHRKPDFMAGRSSGPGRAGAKTFIAARGLDKLEAVAAEERALGRDVTALPLDLSSDESIETLHQTIIDRAGRCDVLVNNAVTRSALVDKAHELDDFDRSFRVNASALFKITELFSACARTNMAR